MSDEVRPGLYPLSGKGQTSPDGKSQKKRSRWVAVAKLLAAAAILFWLYRIRLIDVEPVEFLFVNPWLLFVLILMAWLTFPLCSIRWQMLLRSQDVQLSLREIFRVVYLASFTGLFLPGMVGGDILRIVLGNRTSSAGMAVLTMTVAMDRLLGISALLALGLIASSFLVVTLPGQTGMKQLAILILSLFSCAMVLIAILPWAAQALTRRFSRNEPASEPGFLEALRQALKPESLRAVGLPTLIATWGLSLVIQGKDLLILFLIAETTGFGELGMWGNAVAGSLAFLTQVLPLTPGGLGIGEAAFGQTAQILMADRGPASYGSVMLAFRILTAMTVLPALFLLIRAKPGATADNLRVRD